nr:transposase [Amylibacter sp.]
MIRPPSSTTQICVSSKETSKPTKNSIFSSLINCNGGHLRNVTIWRKARSAHLYRQSQIYARRGVDIDRSTLAFWVGKATHELKPVHDALLAHLKTPSKLFMDETPAPVLDAGRGKTKKGYFWKLARDDRAWHGPEPPGVAFTYAPGRSGKYASEILQSFEGILQVDGYAGYNRVLDLRDNAPIQLFYCWAHARRKLFDLPYHNIALQRKNALFAGHEEGTQYWAMLASLIETCKLNNIEPHSYITGVLTAIVNGHKQKDIEQLLPWNFMA